MLRTDIKSEIFERPLMNVWFDETGVLNIISKKISRTKKNLEDDHEFLRSLTKNKKVCVFIDTSNEGFFTAERIDFAKKELKLLYKAVALYSKTDNGQMAGSILSALIPPSTPMKIFTCEKEAKKWLKKFL